MTYPISVLLNMHQIFSTFYQHCICKSFWVTIAEMIRQTETYKNPLPGFHFGCQATTVLQTELVHFFPGLETWYSHTLTLNIMKKIFSWHRKAQFLWEKETHFGVQERGTSSQRAASICNKKAWNRFCERSWDVCWTMAHIPSHSTPCFIGWTCHSFFPISLVRSSSSPPV